MIIVTGGAGFIGSNLIKGLNDAGHDNIIIVDRLENGQKYKNLNSIRFMDLVEPDSFRDKLLNDRVPIPDIIFHQGAYCNTLDSDADQMLRFNYYYSKDLLQYSMKNSVPFIYASTAAVYIANNFQEEPRNEGYLNAYGTSKLLFDNHVRRMLPLSRSQIVGLRYFNVFGPQESHKEEMASMIYKMYCQLKEDGVIRIFGESGDYGPGEQRRDFIYVKDVVNVNMYFMEKTSISGIFNCGSGQDTSFNQVAEALIRILGKGTIEYVDFPEHLIGKYQLYTKSDNTRLINAGYNKGFTKLEEALLDYVTLLERNNGYLI